MGNIVRKRSFRSGGMSLIGVLIAVMALAVLLAIAIPSYLGNRKPAQDGQAQSETSGGLLSDKPAQDREAQSEIRSVLLSEKSYWLQTGNYTATAADIAAQEPNSSLNPSPALGVAIALTAGSTQTVCLTHTSASGTAFSVWESATVGTYYGIADLSASCPAAALATFGRTGW
jgi:type IV pilus assembly protein PilA